MEAYELLKTGLEGYGIACSDELIDKFKRLTEYMREYNEKVNLTRITEPDDVVKLHYLDSAAIFSKVDVKEGAKVIDVGTGAGFPGLVLKLVRPDLKLTLLDSSNKRIDYLKSAASMLGIDGIEFIHGRGEEQSRDKKHREKYDVVVSRAVAELRKLSELCMPYVKEGGMFVSYKGSDVQNEVDSSKNAVGTLGGSPAQVISVTIPEADVNHNLVVVKKKKATPMQYPRKNAQIQKSPL